jgi:hypothetical protein
MECSSSKLAQRRFTVRMWAAAGLCVLFSIVAALSFVFGHLAGVPAYLVAVLPALPILWALFGTAAYLREETDEFQRTLLVQSLLGGMGVTLAATTIWGYLEDFARAPRLHLAWVYPLFWLFTALSYPVVRMRYR